MLVNICMKFHEDILNSFKVTEQTRFCLRNCYLQSSKGHNSKSINKGLWFLRSAGHQMLVNICMKISWTVFELQSRHDKNANLLFSISKGHNSKNKQSRVTVLALCTSFHVAFYKVSWKYLKPFWSYRADTILWQTDRRPGQKQDVSQPYLGRHN